MMIPCTIFIINTVWIALIFVAKVSHILLASKVLYDGPCVVAGVILIRLVQQMWNSTCVLTPIDLIIVLFLGIALNLNLYNILLGRRIIVVRDCFLLATIEQFLIGVSQMIVGYGGYGRIFCRSGCYHWRQLGLMIVVVTAVVFVIRRRVGGRVILVGFFHTAHCSFAKHFLIEDLLQDGLVDWFCARLAFRGESVRAKRG